MALPWMMLPRMVSRVMHLMCGMVRVMWVVLRMTGMVPVVLLTVRSVSMLQGRVMLLHVLCMFWRNFLLRYVGRSGTG